MRKTGCSLSTAFSMGKPGEARHTQASIPIMHPNMEGKPLIQEAACFTMYILETRARIEKNHPISVRVPLLDQEAQRQLFTYLLAESDIIPDTNKYMRI